MFAVFFVLPELVFWYLAVEDIAFVDLPSDGGVGHAGGDLFAFFGFFDVFLLELDAFEGGDRGAVFVHDGRVAGERAAQYFYADDGGVALPEDVSFKDFYFAGLDEVVELGEFEFLACFVPPGFVVFDEPVDNVVGEYFDGAVVVGLWEVEAEDDGVEGVFVEHGFCFGDVFFADGADGAFSDGDVVFFEEGEERFKAAERVCFDDDAVFVGCGDNGLDFFFEFLFGFFDVLGGADDGHACYCVFGVRSDDANAGGGGDLLDGGEFGAFFAHFRFCAWFEEGFDLCFDGVSDGGDEDGVVDVERAVVDDDVEGGAEPFLFFDFEDGAFGGPVLFDVEVVFEESLGEAGEEHEELRDAFAGFCADGDDGDGFGVIADAVEPVCLDAALVHLRDHVV